MSEQRPVVIVGAGPTGLTAAMELRRFGVPLRLVDSYKTPPDTSRALAVQSRTLELFGQRGLAEAMLQGGNRGHAATIYGNGKPLGTVDFGAIESRFNFVLLLAQSETERILREHLYSQDVTVESDTELIAFSQVESREQQPGVRVILRKPDGSLEQVEAAYLIDAEGAHSTVRHTLDLPFLGTSLEHSYALADLHVQGNLPEDQLSIFLSDAGLLAAFPMGGHRFRVIATDGQAMSDAHEPDLAAMQALWNRGSHHPVHFYDMVWSSHFRINSRMLDHLRHGSIFFGGDSAHVHSPAGGQGMNTGIQDMVNLGWKLALVYRGLAKPDLLDTYSAERIPVIRSLVSTTETATDALDSDSAALRLLVRHALPLALHLAPVRKKGAKTISETQFGYRDSPLTPPSTGSGTLRAGDRLPDLPAAGLEPGQSLLDKLDPSSFTLFAIGDASPPEATDGLAIQWAVRAMAPPVTEPERHRFTSAVGNTRWLLVRPDGYLLWTSSEDDFAALKQWGTTWLNV